MYSTMYFNQMKKKKKSHVTGAYSHVNNKRKNKINACRLLRLQSKECLARKPLLFSLIGQGWEKKDW